MNERTRKRLEAAGARVNTVKEFLGLSDADMSFIEMKIALAKKLREFRKAANLTQEQVAKRVGSSQSRVAKMEAGDPAVTMDLLVGSLLRLGARPQVVAETIETATGAASSAVEAAKPRSKRVSRSGRAAKGVAADLGARPPARARRGRLHPTAAVR
jgi:transcriptional regulator with XRE-family HTH domain